MTLQRARRKRAKLKLGVTGPSGSGKTYSALLIAYGLVGDWEKICVIDTENESASLYENLATASGSEPYWTKSLRAPFTPESYIQAIAECLKAGIEAIIIDSTSHEWSGKGGCLEIHEKLGGQWKDWARVTPRHAAFIEAIVQAPAHVIVTARSKSEWVTETNSKGKQEPKKVGTKAEQREGLEYELTVAWRLDPKHNIATVEKDRTGLFQGQPEEVITVETGRRLLAWCDNAPEVEAEPEVYDATDSQRKILFDIFAELGLDRANAEDLQVMKDVAKAMHGKPLDRGTVITTKVGIDAKREIVNADQ